MSHYDYLDRCVYDFLEAIGCGDRDNYGGIIVAHGDKTRGYKRAWEKAGIPFAHGTAIYLASYLNPYAKETRNTDGGFVKVDQWVIDNYDRFKEHLPDVLPEEESGF